MNEGFTTGLHEYLNLNLNIEFECKFERVDGKRPDRMIIVPWSMGRALVWDATCVDTLAAPHLPSTSQKAAAAAESAQMLKRRK
ncbi:jg2443 [Pararge aegeria aegeria]|uniref:Jg2443 protein n=1 Tax=Pararge aegeria aegeria TaxID=348720 RepID=A0A8S4RVG0_9NEOP|nr:jg2443 [Pararge aegeria aegeria]